MKEKGVIEWNKWDSNLESVKALFIYVMTRELLNNKIVNAPLCPNGSRNSHTCSRLKWQNNNKQLRNQCWKKYPDGGFSSQF